MDPQHFIDIAIGIFCTGLGWFAKVLWDAQQELRREMNALHVKLTEHYVPNARFESVLKEINENLKRIFDKLDDKADK